MNEWDDEKEDDTISNNNNNNNNKTNNEITVTDGIEWNKMSRKVEKGMREQQEDNEENI